MSAVGVTLLARCYHTKYAQNVESLPLVDLLHCKWNANWQKYRMFPDFVTFIYLGGFVFFCQEKEKCVQILACSYCLRAILCVVTQLPPCNPMSQIKLNVKLYSFNPITGFHYDLIYSGHASLMIGILSMSEFPTWLRYLAILLAIFNSFALILTRCHYTIDVVLAWIIVPFLCNNLNKIL